MNKKVINISIAINVITVLATLIAYKFLPPQVPLFYGFPLSERQLTTSLGLFIPPVVSLFLTYINFVLSKRFLDMQFINTILNYSSILISTMSFITVFRIILLVSIY